MVQPNANVRIVRLVYLLSVFIQKHDAPVRRHANRGREFRCPTFARVDLALEIAKESNAGFDDDKPFRIEMGRVLDIFYHVHRERHRGEVDVPFVRNLKLDGGCAIFEAAQGEDEFARFARVLDDLHDRRVRNFPRETEALAGGGRHFVSVPVQEADAPLAGDFAVSDRQDFRPTFARVDPALEITEEPFAGVEEDEAFGFVMLFLLSDWVFFTTTGREHGKNRRRHNPAKGLF